MPLNIQSIPYPELTTAERNLIVTPIKGYRIYNTTDSEFQMWDGVAWVLFGNGGKSYIINSESTNSYVQFGNEGANEYLEIATLVGATPTKAVQIGDGSTHTKLIVDPDGNIGNLTGVWFGGDIGLYEHDYGYTFRNLSVNISNSRRFVFTYGALVSADTRGAFFGYGTSNSTTPTLKPRQDSGNTGLGGVQNQLSLIIDGIEGLRVDGSTNPGVVKLGINPDGAVGVNTGIWWGDGDTGIWQNVDDSIIFTFGGFNTYGITYDYFRSARDSSGFYIDTTATSSSNPVYTFRNDNNSGVGLAGVGQLSLIANSIESLRINSTAAHSVAGIADYETLVINDDDIPNKKYVDDTSIKPYVSVGTGGQFSTIEDAVAAGHRYLLITSNITLTQDIVNSSSESLKIIGINSDITLSNDSYVIQSASGGAVLENLTLIATVNNITHLTTPAVFRNCNYDHTGSYDLNFSKFYNCNITFNAGLVGGPQIYESIINLSTGGNYYFKNSIYFSKWHNCVINGAGTDVMYYGKFFNCEFNSIDRLQQPDFVENCEINGNINTVATPNVKILNNTCVNLSVSGDYCLVNGNKLSGNLTINSSSSYQKVLNNDIEGTTVINTGAAYNVIIGNTFSGGFTDNSGESTNEIFGNVE